MKFALNIPHMLFFTFAYGIHPIFFALSHFSHVGRMRPMHRSPGPPGWPPRWTSTRSPGPATGRR